MFDITIEDSKIIRGIFEAISAIVGECVLTFDANGISLNAIDEGRICFIGLHLDKDDFDIYECSSSYDLGLNIDDMVKILKRSNIDDSITFKYTPESERIKIIMKSKVKKKNRNFSLQLITLENAEIKPQALEQIEYKAKATIPLAYLDEAIKDADIFSESVEVSIIDGKGLIFKSEGQKGESECVLEYDDDAVEGFTATESGEGIFALDYLKNIAKIGNIAEKIEMSLNSGTPLNIKLNILVSSSFKYYLAPRIEEDDNDNDDDDYNDDY